MSTRYKGSILSSTAAASSSTAAYGIWKQSEVAQLIYSVWPYNDIYWSSVSMLLCGEGTNGAQNNTFIDSSANNFAITRNGTATQGSVNPFGAIAPYTTTVDGGSGYFNGTSDYLTLAQPTAFTFNTLDFTVEAWVYPTANPVSFYCVIDARPSNLAVAWAFGLRLITGNLKIEFFNGTQINGSITVPLNTWTHIAFSRSSSTLKGFVNGVLDVNTTMSTNLTTSGTQYIGALRDPTYNTGYISNLRVVKNVAVYTAAFTPSTTPLTAISGTSLLLGFTNAGIIDNAMQNALVTVGTSQVSTSTFKYGTGSIAFSGTGAWLTSADNTSLQMGTGDFTIEGWVYVNAIGTAYGIVSKGAASTGWSVNITSGNKLQFSYTATVLTGTTSLAASTWYYFAVVRSGSGTGNLKIYFNGTVDATSAGSVTDNFNQTNILYVGASRTGTTPLNGYIDDLRITKGVARYTADFVAPLGPFPNK
jgi:hypothetical protein